MNRNVLDLIADCLQVYNTVLLVKDSSNDDVMRALQEQNTKYFEKIIKELDDIKNLLTILTKDNIK